MKALGKLLGLVALGLLLVIVVGGFALTHLFDPNDYKDEIRQLARDKAGVDLRIGGDIGWSLFPWLGLELHDTELASLQSAEQPFARLRMLGLSVRVLPLLRRELQMSDITVDGLQLDLVRNEQGRGNWEGVGQPAASDTGEPGAEPPSPTPDSAPEDGAEPRRPLVLDIDSLTVRDARVLYHDARSGTRLSAEGIELTTGAIREASAIPFRLNAFFGSNQPVMRARTELQGDLRFDNRLRRYQVDGLRLSGEASGEPLGGKTLAFDAQGELLVDRAAQIAEWNGLKFSANQLRGLGQLSARDLESEPKLSGTLSLARFDLAGFLESIGHPLPAMAAADALRQVELVTRLTGSSKALALEDLRLQIDGTEFAGTLAVDDFARRALRVAIKGGTLDLDRYLPPRQDAPQESVRKGEVRDSQAALAGAGTTPLPNAPTTFAWSEEELLPVEPLRSLALDLSLNLAGLKVADWPLEQFTAKASASQGVVQLERLRARLFGGGIESSARLDVRPAVPTLQVEKRLLDVPLESLLKAQGEEVIAKGLLHLEASVQTQGTSQRAWVDHLDGHISFSVSNGMLVQANLEQQICQAIATLNRKPLSGEPRGRDTPFQRLSGSLRLKDGVARNDDLKVLIPGIAVNGNGDVDLRVLGMDYRIGVIIEGDKSDMPDPACQVNERYVGLEWPLRCRGPLELGARACRLDQQGLSRIATRLAGDKLSEKLEEKLGDKVSPELKDALRGLFRQ